LEKKTWYIPFLRGYFLFIFFETISIWNGSKIYKQIERKAYFLLSQFMSITQFLVNARGWLIDYLLFYVPLKNISFIWRRHHSRWRASTFRPMLGAQGLWAERDLYRATPVVTRDLGFFGLIRRTAPFSRLLRHSRGCGGSILTRILTGLMQEELTCISILNKRMGNKNRCLIFKIIFRFHRWLGLYK
jgi:hypothetical protein